MSSWLDKIRPTVNAPGKSAKGVIPEGLWKKCPKCSAALYRPELEKNLDVCPKCGHHMRISARRRVDVFLDPQGRVELNAGLEPSDLLKFKDTQKYKDRLASNQKSTQEKDALLTFKGTVNGVPVVIAVFEFSFLGGSMGSVVGEKFVRAIKLCLDESKPLVCFSASGGARMQEALISLMQMAKTSAALEKLKAEGLPFISVLTDPVFGGVSASLAMLGIINVAEPGALVGFAGPRVIEQTVREKLPDGFQRSEFLLEHGTVDMILSRGDLRDRISSLLAKLMNLPQPDAPPAEDEEIEVAQDDSNVEASSPNEDGLESTTADSPEESPSQPETR